MGWFTRFWGWLFKDKRSDWEQTQERRFITAVNKLKNYSVSDRGGLSRDPEELRELVMTGREELKHLVQPSPNRTTQTHQSTKAPLTAHQYDSTLSASGMQDFVEVLTWRRVDDHAAIRYVCLQDLSKTRFAVAFSDRFCAPFVQSAPHALEAKLAKRVASTYGDDKLEWFGSLNAAMDAHDERV